MHRRRFLETLAAPAALCAGLPFALPPRRALSAPADGSRRTGVIGVTTVYRRHSHADVIFTKILRGWKHDGGPGPDLKLTALYVEQFPEGDLARRLCREHGVPLCSSIAEAMRVGLADPSTAGVLSVGEHGDYPYTPDTRQHMYPRRRFFDEIVRGFDRADRVLPLFNDKHLSYRWADAQHMYRTAKRKRIPFMAGSSLPVAWRIPPLQLPAGCELEEALAVGYGGAESYGFHALEVLQCMVERRRGGETGVASVQAVTGEAIWRAADAGRFSPDLLAAALRAQGVEHAEGEELRRRLAGDTPFYLIEYRDGLRATVAMCNGVARQFSFAARLRGEKDPRACLFALQDEEPYMHFGWLLHAIHYMLVTGRPAYPVERTLLTTGVLDRAMHSLAGDGRRLETPELNVHYRPTDWPFAKLPVGTPPPRTVARTNR
ncbi:MAG: hypothetical protein D6725_09215 [Planctomycetota bacterium]|nr:MAG: hypothetical protein D6725_09215 [Planctomycetota bacterium]